MKLDVVFIQLVVQLLYADSHVSSSVIWVNASIFKDTFQRILLFG